MDAPDHIESWEDFMEEWDTTDMDMNLVFRWDWEKPQSCDYDDPEEIPDHDTLRVFFMLQRKGIFMPITVSVTETDEPAVREWLQKR